MISQNDKEFLLDRVQAGIMTADQANIENVRIRRVFLVVGTIPASVRKALNSAVKEKYLCHKKRDGISPEIYYHPCFEYLAIQEVKSYVKSVNENLKKICI